MYFTDLCQCTSVFIDTPAHVPWMGACWPPSPGLAATADRTPWPPAPPDSPVSPPSLSPAACPPTWPVTMATDAGSPIHFDTPTFVMTHPGMAEH